LVLGGAGGRQDNKVAYSPLTLATEWCGKFVNILSPFTTLSQSSSNWNHHHPQPASMLEVKVISFSPPSVMMRDGFAATTLSFSLFTSSPQKEAFERKEHGGLGQERKRRRGVRFGSGGEERYKGKVGLRSGLLVVERRPQVASVLSHFPVSG